MGAQTAAWFESLVGSWSAGMARACWQGGLFILAVWIVCRLIARLPAVARHWLWWLACLKLLISLFWAAPLDLPVLPLYASRQVTAASRFELPAPSLESGGFAVLRARSLVPEYSLLSLRNVLFAAWLVGTMTCLVEMGRQRTRAHRLVLRACSLEGTSYAAQARQLGVLLGLSRSPRLLASSEVTSPLVVGILTPTVILPEGFSDGLSPDEIRAMLAHELAHIRRHDLLLGLIPAIAQALFFPFPPLWMACREWQTAREAACDVEALEATGVPAVCYGQLLLKIVARDERPGHHATLGATAGYHTLKTRLRLLKFHAADTGTFVRLAAGTSAMLALLFLIPWRITARQTADTIGVQPQIQNLNSTLVPPEDVADVHSQERYAEGDPDKRYLLIGPRSTPPPGGYRLLIVLPGGDGGVDFQWFARRIFKFALSDDYLIVEPIATAWSPDQFSHVVWPTDTNPWLRMRFSTEDFVEAAVRDVRKSHNIDARYVFTLGWASGGPPAYALSLRQRKPITGSFVAMSVFEPEVLPPLRNSHGHPYFLLHPSDALITPLTDAERARTALARNGATVELATYEGGYGWHGNVFGQIRRGIRWLEAHRAR